uniref:Peptidase_M16_C domain-containing protein n=1 Tax=Taenia asiatica TaxID=60517 RepID=A0A0R3WEQ0_TAEAS
LRSYFQQVNIHLVEDYMKALEGLTVNDMLLFVPAFFSRLYVKAFAYGNVSAAEAKEYVDYTLSALKPREVAVLKPYPKAALPACLNRLRVMNFDKTDVNTSLVLISPLQGTPSDDLRYEVMNELLGSCLQESAFAYLRTRETLGYAVGLYSWSLASTTGQCGLSVGVSSQANKFDSNLVAGRIYAFWYRIVPYIVLHLNEEAFQTSVEALIAANLLEDATMKVEIDRNRKEVFSDCPIFNRRERSVEILRHLKLRDLHDFYTETYYNLEKQPTLMIQVDALPEVVSSDASKNLKTFDWPLCIVPMVSDQVEAERSAALEVDVLEAVRMCAPSLVVDAAKGDPSAGVKSLHTALPPIVEISEIRDFKHKVLFPSSC